MNQRKRIDWHEALNGQDVDAFYKEITSCLYDTCSHEVYREVWMALRPILSVYSTTVWRAIGDWNKEIMYNAGINRRNSRNAEA